MGTQTIGILQGMTTKLAEAREGRAQRGDSSQKNEARHREDAAAIRSGCHQRHDRERGGDKGKA